MKTRAGIICVVLVSALQTGCWDKLELNDRAYVNALAIDKVKETEKKETGKEPNTERFAVSVSLSDLKAYEGNDQGGKNEEKNKSIKKSSGQTISSAIRGSGANTSQELFFGHTKAVFLGVEFLKDKTLLMEALDSLERDNELSRKVLVLATEGDAADTIEAKPVGEPSIGAFVDSFYRRLDSGTTFKMTLEDLIIRLRSDSNAVIPRIKEDEGELSIGGAAVLNNFSLCGFIDEATTRGYLWQEGDVEGTKVIVEYEGVPVPFSVLSHSKKISFRDGGDAPVMRVEVRANGSVDGYIFGKSISSERQIKEIEALIENSIKDEIESTNRLFQKELKTDALNINDMMRKKDYALWVKYNNWQETFESMKFDISIDAEIKSAGLLK